MRLLQSLIAFTLLIASLVDAVSYENHGSDWTETLCTGGVNQSPINIIPSTLNSEPICRHVDIKYPGAVSAVTENNGHTLQASGSFIEVDIHDASGAVRLFKALQFHLHAKSEHTVDGQQYDLELHIVCKQQNADSATKLAVFGIFFEVTEDEMEEAAVFKQFQFPTSHATGSKTSTYQMDFKAIMNLVFINGQKLYTYEGSLTTPGCDEIVSWHVFKNPLKITEATYDKFKDLWYNDEPEILHGNWRITKPLNGRTVTYSKFCSSSSYLLKLSSVAVFFALLVF